ncbi:MAG: SEC-C domain-containing protein [Crocinitomicaceae bacterium]|nr:SEC-C domain-containing protein [Crocinitomicaceae bacterium]
MKTGRNDPCPCGSGKKHKKCCWLTPEIVLPVEKPQLIYNKQLNRYESKNDHHYANINNQDFNNTDSRSYLGKIKCRLVHEDGNSIIIPDYILLKNGWIQPLHFTAPLLFKLDETSIECNFFIDIQNGITIKIHFLNHQLLQTYADKSQLFDCEILGPADIEEYACGEFKTIGNKIYFKLYHHTSEGGYNGITGSKNLRSSKWNYRGSKECINFHFAYFTHIPKVKFPNDLITVAMSADGNIDYMIDSFVLPKVMPSDYRKRHRNSIYTAKVYRSTTSDRNYTIEFLIPIECLDVKHIYLHHQVNSVFYEMCFPYIHRIKLKANSILTFTDDYCIINDDAIVNSEYSIIGDARNKEGLAAPFEEDETKFIYKIEDCGKESILDFWFSHANKDLFTGKMVETLKLKEVEDNPTK